MLKRFIVTCVSCVALIGCMPRGETITVDQSLELAKQRFENALLISKGKVPAEINPAIDTLKADLERFAEVDSADAYKQEAATLSAALRPLIVKAGYPTRPSLDELTKIYQNVGEAEATTEFAPASAKLLAQRTYHCLSAELENARFSL